MSESEQNCRGGMEEDDWRKAASKSGENRTTVVDSPEVRLADDAKARVVKQVDVLVVHVRGAHALGAVPPRQVLEERGLEELAVAAQEIVRVAGHEQHLPLVRLGRRRVTLEPVLVAARLMAHLAEPAQLLETLGLQSRDRYGYKDREAWVHWVRRNTVGNGTRPQFLADPMALGVRNSCSPMAADASLFVGPRPIQLRYREAAARRGCDRDDTAADELTMLDYTSNRTMNEESICEYNKAHFQFSHLVRTPIFLQIMSPMGDLDDAAPVAQVPTPLSTARERSSDGQEETESPIMRHSHRPSPVQTAQQDSPQVPMPPGQQQQGLARMVFGYPNHNHAKLSIRAFDGRETYEGLGSDFEQWGLMFIVQMDMAERA
ncbi:unnamed protein product [Phytophthora fragariaefolia]|uniref:Unnamed protein product n=1 Tax=Phytophthora fragariaefolia TaxID=1490495 RepID=A0A9W6Y9D7_9STRA|nr:unnamed protein product [Phytophthora fragariaefolia]